MSLSSSQHVRLSLKAQGSGFEYDFFRRLLRLNVRVVLVLGAIILKSAFQFEDFSINEAVCSCNIS